MIGSQELHMMIDLETISTRPNAAISQIGGCVFQPAKRDPIVKQFVYHIDVQSCLDIGLHLDWNTIKWWMRQEDNARVAFQREDTMPIKDALAYIEGGNWGQIAGVWSHGATFDLVILEYAYRRIGKSPPWNYKMVRDTRTIFWASPDAKWPDNPVKHSAVHDAVNQAHALTDALRKLGLVKEIIE